MALETLKMFLNKGREELLKLTEILKIAESLGSRFTGLQCLLLQGLFGDDKKIQKLSFELLLMSWCGMHDYVTDPNDVGYLYTCLYTYLWISVRLLDTSDPNETMALDYTVEKFKQTLNLRKSKEAEKLAGTFRKALDLLRGRESLASKDAILESLLIGIYEIFIPLHVNNITEFLTHALALEEPYQGVVLQMIRVLWISSARIDPSRTSLGGLEALVRKLSIVSSDTTAIVREILKDQNQDFAKEVDLTSQGKIQALPIKQNFAGSIKEAGDWMMELGIVPSNRMYMWQ